MLAIGQTPADGDFAWNRQMLANAQEEIESLEAINAVLLAACKDALQLMGTHKTAHQTLIKAIAKAEDLSNG